MAELLKKLANYGLVAAFVVAIFVVIPALFIVGAVKLGTILFPWLVLASLWVFAFVLLIVVPLSFIQPCRPFAASALLISSYVFGLTVWIEALLVTEVLWGTFAVIIGLSFAGVGIVPVGILASLFHGAWSRFWDLIVLAAVTYGLRFYAVWLASKADSVEASKRLQPASLKTAV